MKHRRRLLEEDTAQLRHWLADLETQFISARQRLNNFEASSKGELAEAERNLSRLQRIEAEMKRVIKDEGL
ncbi:MAG: hypothetical protein ABF868_04490 [Sporolactobacillus sp.]